MVDKRKGITAAGAFAPNVIKYWTRTDSVITGLNNVSFLLLS